MKRRTLVILLVCVAVAAAIGAGVGWSLWNKPHAKVENMDGVAISATELCRQFAANETKANAQYLNKALEVSGTITKQESNQDGALVVTLQGDDADMSVLCTMRDKNVVLETGKPVIIKGECSGNDMFGVLVTGCIVKN
jgi:hypothetical protein